MNTLSLFWIIVFCKWYLDNVHTWWCYTRTDISINKPKVFLDFILYSHSLKIIQLKVDYQDKIDKCIVKQTSEVVVVCDCKRLLSPSRLQFLMIRSKPHWLKTDQLNGPQFVQWHQTAVRSLKTAVITEWWHNQRTFQHSSLEYLSFNDGHSHSHTNTLIFLLLK